MKHAPPPGGWFFVMGSGERVLGSSLDDLVARTHARLKALHQVSGLASTRVTVIRQLLAGQPEWARANGVAMPKPFTVPPSALGPRCAFCGGRRLRIRR